MAATHELAKSGAPASVEQSDTEAATTLSSDPVRNDNRRIHRIPTRLVVTHTARSAALGESRDISLHGLFIVTEDPFPIGAVIPLSLELKAGKPELVVRAEVMRRTPEGMGLSFLDMPSDEQKRLRRYVAEITSVEGTRRTVGSLHDLEKRTTEPIASPARISRLLERTRVEKTEITLIPVDRLVRDHAVLTTHAGGELQLTSRDRSLLSTGDDVFGLVILDFVSYSFTAQVIRADGSDIRLTTPSAIVYSERRTRTRARAVDGTCIRWPMPWAERGFIEFAVHESSPGGLSFRAEAKDCQLAPGMPLHGAVLVVADREVPLTSAEIRHITRVEDPNDPWLRIGVSYGSERAKPAVDNVAVSEQRKPRGFMSRVKQVTGKIKTGVAYAIHSGRRKLQRPDSGSAPFRTVRFRRDDNLEIVGLLNRSFNDDERLKCPLVIVAPAYAGRKEQMSFLAMTVVENFRRAHRDVAVLRIDGTNNLGQSGKDPGCRGPGEHTLHYTVSGGAEDLRATL
ncbi:MAG: hypothetical protein ACI9MR_004348, partial [Myxococcota bacterium]